MLDITDYIGLAQILRVAARNSAAFEWLHHAHVGVDAGLTNEQLTIIRDLNTPLPLHTTPAPLSAIQAAALRFAEASTFNVIIPRQTVEDLKLYLTDSQQLLEAAAVPATYNMVSRLLVALDVGEMGAEALPLPETNQEVHRVDVGQGVKLHVKTAKRIIDGEEAPWLIFINSLMSSERMWEGCLPRLSKKYNLLTFDQRGHGEVGSSFFLPQISTDPLDNSQRSRQLQQPSPSSPTTSLQSFRRSTSPLQSTPSSEFRLEEQPLSLSLKNIQLSTHISSLAILKQPLHLPVKHYGTKESL
jgi:hypothetical protein